MISVSCMVTLKGGTEHVVGLNMGSKSVRLYMASINVSICFLVFKMSLFLSLSFRCVLFYSISATVSSDTELKPYWHTLIIL